LLIKNQLDFSRSRDRHPTGPFCPLAGRKDPGFSLLADTQLVRPAKMEKEFESVVEWLEAFGVYMLIVSTV
jgi:hypothetical protein